ncbi:histidine kinase dimerization/phosphoacceptor domain-containing protein [Microbacterium hominis]|uniref:Histidine kinase n=1 Tax=Microbacterium hominis TaxID=162426 RepID=A0A7D4PTP5_9MICO|nr:histidine kinase dimerization/phosphoacceptor domain-containing protein [Microbacterium hominis]QKJ19033.1 histidine kinase [Microbacterium hominis]
MKGAALWALLGGCIAIDLVAISVLVTPAQTLTPLMRAPWAGSAALVAGLMAAAVSIVLASTRARGGRTAALALASAAWLAPTLGAGAPVVLSALAGSVAVMLPAALAHLCAPAPPPAGPIVPRLVLSGYVVAAAAGVLRLTMYQPFDDPGCWADCRRSPFALLSWVPAVDVAWALSAGVCAALALSLTIQASSARSSPAWRLTATTATRAVVVIGLAVVAVAAPGSHADPADGSVAAGLLITAAGSIALAGLYLVRSVAGAGRARRLRAIVAGADGGSWERVLGEAVGDPTLRVAYRVADGWVDESGAPRDPDVRAVRVVSGGREVAAITHRRDLDLLVDEIGPALRLAIGNEALRIELDGRIRELRVSRARVVAAADARRRALERDLHDGAQQELIGLAWRLRAAADAAGRQGSPVAAELEQAVGEARAALEDLREVAHGIYPVVLANDGLVSALRSHALTAPVAVSVRGEPPRAAAAEEAALYLFAVEAIASAAAGGAPDIEVILEGSAVAISVTVRAPGFPRLPVGGGVVDRIGAVGGAIAPEGTSARVPTRSETPA